MDLAKIRKKALQNRPVVDSEPVRQDSSGVICAPVDRQGTVEPVSSLQTAPPACVSTDVGLSAPAFRLPAAPASSAKQAVRDPLQIILMGRQSAGCGDEQLAGEDGREGALPEENLEFLCFRVSDEIYGINIMDIKEIIKPREVTEIPRAPAFVSGILSLRGIITTVIDMRIRLGLSLEAVSGRERVVVVRSGESLYGLLVDEVIQVVRIAPAAVEPPPTVLEGIDRDFVRGIGRAGGKLIIILNLENISDIHHY